MWWCGIVVVKNVADAMRCAMSDLEMMQCVVMSDVVVKCMWNMVWCEICYDAECWCGVE